MWDVSATHKSYDVYEYTSTLNLQVRPTQKRYWHKTEDEGSPGHYDDSTDSMFQYYLHVHIEE